MSETDLIKQCQQGDRQALGELLDHYYEVIFNIAWRWCGNHTNAEDITQNTCIKLAGNISKFDFKSSFTTWLFRLTINCAKDFYKSPTQHNQREQADNELVHLDDGNTTHEERLHARQILEKMSDLPADLVDALVKVFVFGLSHAQVARQLSVKESTVSWRVHQARKQLKALCAVTSTTVSDRRTRA